MGEPLQDPEQTGPHEPPGREAARRPAGYGAADRLLLRSNRCFARDVPFGNKYMKHLLSYSGGSRANQSSRLYAGHICRPG